MIIRRHATAGTRHAASRADHAQTGMGNGCHDVPRPQTVPPIVIEAPSEVQATVGVFVTSSGHLKKRAENPVLYSRLSRLHSELAAQITADRERLRYESPVTFRHKVIAAELQTGL
jgi:hypothetical protein